jgi:hypothetical protein
MSSSSTASPRSGAIVRRAPEGVISGLALVVIGLIVATGFIVADADRYTLVSIGLTALVAFALTREHAWAIAAGFTGGLGTAIVLIADPSMDPMIVPGVLFASVASGFVAIWLLGLVAVPRETHPWPLVPATVLGLLGAAFLAKQPGAFDWIQIGLAVVLTSVGVAVMLGRGRRHLENEGVRPTA